MKRVWDWIINHPYLSSFFASFFILALFFPVSVREGTINRCYYGEIVKKEVSEVFVPWWIKNKYQVKTRWFLCSTHKEAEKLYLTWRGLIRAGEKEEAQACLNRLRTLVGSDWSPAKRVAGGSLSTSKSEKSGGVSVINNRNTLGQGGNSNKNQSSGGESEDRLTGGEELGTYGGDLYSLLPVSLNGYEFFLKEEYPLQALAIARPLNDKNVVMVLFSIDRVDNQTAQNYLGSFKESYNKDWQEVKVDGLKAYWGKTKNSQEALLAWRRFDLLYVIELTTKVDAGNYRSKMIEWGNNLF